MLLLILLAASGPARAAATPAPVDASVATLSDEDLRAQLEAYLGTIDTPVTPAQWRALGSRATPILEARARDREALPSRRARSLDALTALGATAVVVELARAEGEPFVVRQAALRGAARLLRNDRAAAVLRPILEGSA